MNPTTSHNPTRRELLRLAGFGALWATLGAPLASWAASATTSRHIFALRGDGKVAVIDSADDALIKVIETGGKGGTLGSLTRDGSRLFVANAASGQTTVSLIDAQNLTFIKNIELGNMPKHPVVSPDGAVVAVNNWGLDGQAFRVSFLSPSDGAVLAVAEVPVSTTDVKGPVSMHGSWSPDGALFAIGNYVDNTAVFIDRKGKIVATVKTAGNPHYFDWVGREVWITVEADEPKGPTSSAKVVVLDMSDPSKPKEKQTFALAVAAAEQENIARIEGHHGAFANDGKTFVVCNRGAGSALEGITIGLFDRSGKNLATLTAQAKGVAHAYFTPNGRYALITQYNDTVLPVLDLEKRAIVANLDAGAGGHLGHAVFTADSRKAYVSNRKSDEVVVVDLEKMAIAKRIQTAPSGQAQGQVVNGFYNVFERVVNPNLAS